MASRCVFKQLSKYIEYLSYIIESTKSLHFHDQTKLSKYYGLMYIMMMS